MREIWEDLLTVPTDSHVQNFTVGEVSGKDRYILRKLPENSNYYVTIYRLWPRLSPAPSPVRSASVGYKQILEQSYDYGKLVLPENAIFKGN